ncbi:CBF domain-containing protein [Cephalotus follicularis]|uniref:CBF domain-containing protein n=1 Tax=Cephalotus follicularis TaxID=3775 RepID=A0A1Q3B0U3_CEPFO|nr:CBF domain-containing protein [Cephalotus follicularis]
MSKSKLSKSDKNPESIDSLKSDIASFASSLGLSSSLPSSGFNDVDFRKRRPLKPHTGKSQKFDQQQKPISTHKPKLHFESTNRNSHNPKHDTKPKPPVLSLENGNETANKKKLDTFKNIPKLPLVKASSLSVWYVDAMELEEKVLGEERGKRLEVRDVEEWKRVVEKNREVGERLMWQYGVDYESLRGQSRGIKMLVATQRSGTAADKVSAFSVMVGDNPVANLRSLDALLGMVTSRVGKRHALTGFEALKELFTSSLLPDRKLKTLLQRPLNNIPETKDGYSLLLFWYWEECLKHRYERFVIALEEASRDMLPILKDKALKTMYALLKSKSEQERRLLSALVNKLGDPQNKGASNADFYLTNLLSDHPNMKVVVIDEVDSFLFRPHLGLRAKYHAVNFLSQTRLSHRGDGPKVAKRLIDVYFALFKVLITEAVGGQKMDKSTKEEDRKASSFSKERNAKSSVEPHVELDSRLLSALLTGVNRAFPFVSSNEADDIIEVQTPMLFQLVHSKNFNVGVQALMLLDKISSKNQIVSDRFYRALYSKLLLPAAMNSSKAEMFIGLVLRAMKSDINLKRVAAFSKRLLQVALQQPPQYACGCLFLLSEVLKARPPLWNMMLQNESVDEDLERFEDIMEDTDDGPDIASQKEENDVKMDHGDDGAISDSNFSEDEVGSLDSYSEADASDEAEEFLLRDHAKDLQKPKIVSDDKVHQPQASSTRSFLPGGYNPRHREPSYCNADHASWWELMVLASHVHPSVATMAGTLLSGANVVYNGNPLNDLSLGAFLDKFMEKKPKASSWHGGSQIEPAKKLDMNNQLIGPEILSLAEVDVPPEDFVFHKFYVNKMNSSKKPKKKIKKKGTEEDMAAEELYAVDDGEVDGSDESDNEEIDNMLDSANLSLEADGDYDYDDLDQVANEDDNDLVGDVSDAEMDAPSDIAEGEDFDAITDDDEGDDVPHVDDGSDGEDEFNQRKRSRKHGRKAGASPFASLEDYEHLIGEDDPTPNESRPKKKMKKKHTSRKKKRSSE